MTMCPESLVPWFSPSNIQANARSPASLAMVAVLLVYAVGSLTRATEFLYFQF